MSELRYDPLGGYWVNIAAIRAERPNEFRRMESRRPDAICPFCAGQENQTPPSDLVLPPGAVSGSPLAPDHSGSPRWLVRVVPNKYPAFVDRAATAAESFGPYLRQASGGRQEIVIETPRHVTSLSQLTDDELTWTFRAYQLRIESALQLPNVRQVMIFRNCRSEAGASIEHAHSQVVASPIFAAPLAARWERCAAAARTSGKTILQSLVEFELLEKARIVGTRGRFVAFCPFASRFAFQIWIAAKSGSEAFQRLSAEDLADVSQLTRRCVERLEQTLDAPPYNWILHLPPRLPSERDPTEIFPWFIELIPRLARLAGFELGEGGWVNDWPPEFAASKLRAD